MLSGDAAFCRMSRDRDGPRFPVNVDGSGSLESAERSFESSVTCMLDACALRRKG